MKDPVAGTAFEAAPPARVIVPNFKRRWSGVTSTVYRLLPLQATRIPIACVGPRVPEEAPHLTFGEVLGLDRRTRRVWHARRNVEMVAGVLLRSLLRKRLSLVFTSAAQRRHTRYTRWLLRRMDRVVATSEQAAAYLDVPSVVVMHGVDCARFRPAADKAGLKRSMGFSPDRRLVGCFGRVRAQKGTDLFVDAMLEQLDRHPDVDGVIVGAATRGQRDFETVLREKVRTAGHARRVHFLGEQPDEAIPALFAMLDVFVAPPRWEGFGLTVLEAMASGVPVVASDAGTFGQTVTDGETGFVVPIGDLVALSEAIDRLLSEPAGAGRMGRRAREDMLERFDLEREAEALVAIYEELLEER